MKKILPALITGLLLSGATHADENPVTAEKLSDSVYVLFGQGGNIAASVGEDGIYIIDDQFAKLSNDIKKTISDLKLHFNNEHAHVVHYAYAHTDGDSVIFFNNDNIVHMGDIYFNFGSLPFVDVDSGGSVDGILAAVNDVIKQIDERTIGIPGHGPVSDRSGLVTYAKLVKKAKDLMLKAMQNNASLEQEIKADPLAELGLEYAGWLPKEKVTTLFYRSLK